MSDEGKTIFHERVEWLGRNYDNKSGKSDKFYEITITTNSGTYFREVRHYGRYGTKGQTKVLSHYGEWSALNSARSQLAKKRDKGYTDVVAPLTRLASVMDDEAD